MARMTRNKKENSILENGKRSILQIVFSRTMLIMLLIVLEFVYLIGRVYAFAEYIPIFLGSEFLFVAGMLIVILNTKENPMIKLSWCFLVGVFPILGSVVYLVIRYDLGYRVQQSRIMESEKETMKYLKNQETVLAKLYKEDMQTYRLGMYLRDKSESTISTNTQVIYFPIGEKQFEEMVRQLEDAEKFIFLEYFMISHGKMWNTILDILIRKAKAGVEVRLLYDGSCAVYLLPYNYPKDLKALGIECRMFSPPIPFLSTHYNNRDHRKILVIDGKIAFTGGVNLCDEYINVNSPCGHWKDVGVMLCGDAVRDFTLMFLQMWAATEKRVSISDSLCEDSVRKYIDVWVDNQTKWKERIIQRDAKSAHENGMIDIQEGKSNIGEVVISTDKIKKQEFSYGYVIPYGDSPMDEENVGEMVYLDILNQAKEYVYIMTPYLILDHEMVTAISFAGKRGVKVKIILPHIPDKKYAFVLAKEHYKELLEAGVEIYEYTPGFVHAKVFVSDDCRAVVGTINLDYRSLYWHYECAVYLYQVPAVFDIRKDVEETLKMCQKISMEDVKQRRMVSKVAGAILKLVAPLM